VQTRVVAALAACIACEAGSGHRTAFSDSTPVTRPEAAADAGRADSVEVLQVNRGTQGMRSTIRWLLSPDRRAIVVVEDAVSVEAEALPDGFLYASETTGAIVQLDDVWDVAPSPDWTRLAFGRAYVLRAGERDTMPSDEWGRLEARLPEDVVARDRGMLRRRLEAHAFPASGMALMLGLGLTQVVWVDSLGPGRMPSPAGPTHSLHGWRVRWTPSGDTLAAGAAPRMVQDDAPPARWVLVRPRRWADHSDTLGVTTDSSRFARIAWTVGPTIELATAVDLSAGRTLAIDGGTVESRDGMIRLTRRDPAAGPMWRAIGPGIPLAATANGRFIAALVPRTSAQEHEMRAYPVVYHVIPR
jgi:hypothetical protein